MIHCTRLRVLPHALSLLSTMVWKQVQITLQPRSKGTYLVSNEVIPQLPVQGIKVGLVNLFLQHTLAALTINENCDPTVRQDMTDSFDRIVPEGDFYAHDDEGPDDMPGHVKLTITGVSLTIPITNGKLALGTWQGIYLCEFRTYRHTRRVIATIQGE